MVDVVEVLAIGEMMSTCWGPGGFSNMGQEYAQKVSWPEPSRRLSCFVSL